MKVLHVNTSATSGGAAIAAQRIIHAEQQAGIEATLLTRHDASPVLGLYHKAVERLSIWVQEGFRKKNLWSIDTATQGSDITHQRDYREADIIHLHWVNQAMLSLDQLEQIFRSGKPVVWTLHDMWPFTGICHHADNCTAWADGSACHRDCPLNTRLAHHTYERKLKAFAHATNLTLVGCSEWLAGLAAQSPLLRGHKITAIPNPIDTDFYAPSQEPKLQLRQAIGLENDLPAVLFVAYKATDPQKGLSFLLEAMKDEEVNIVVVGQHSESVSLPTGSKAHIHPMGLVTDVQLMRSLYRGCDVLAMPTLRDNLPNTIVEAMSCALPCVGFEIGGLPEMIEHRENGYLAHYRDVASLREGILSVLQSRAGNPHNFPSYSSLSLACRQKAQNSYSEAAVATRYKALYAEALKHHH